jgi:pilus assembly protein CpaB
MKVKTWIPLVLAVVLGLAALKFTRDAMSKGGKADDSKFVATVTAAKDIAPGQPITAADLTTAKVEAKAFATGAFTTPAEVVDRIALNGLVKGQPVLESTLAPKGAAAGVQALIEPGMRAITIQVDEFTGLGGLLLPGAHVDILAMLRDQDNKISTSRTIVQNVEIRAVGRQITGTTPQTDPNLPAGAPAPYPTNVTLLVTPEQAEAIQLASVGGRPWIALRNSADQKEFRTEGTTLADLRGEKDFNEPSDTALTGKTGSNSNKSTELAFDPFAAGNSGTSSHGSRTRTVTFIRGTKEQTVTVDAASTPPANWVGAETDNKSATKE